MNEKWPVHLFEYQYEGSIFTFEIPARSMEDAQDRIQQLAQAGRYLGVLQAKLPVEFGVFARLICWWKNRNRK